MLVVSSLNCRASTPRQRTAASSSDGVYEVARLPPVPSLPFPLLTDLALSSCYFGNWRSPRHFGCRLGTLPFPLSGTKLETSVSRAPPHRRADWGHFHRGLGGKAGRSAALPLRRRGEFVHCTLQNLQFLGRKLMSELKGREQFSLRYSRPSVLKW